MNSDDFTENLNLASCFTSAYPLIYAEPNCITFSPCWSKLLNSTKFQTQHSERQLCIKNIIPMDEDPKVNVTPRCDLSQVDILEKTRLCVASN